MGTHVSVYIVKSICLYETFYNQSCFVLSIEPFGLTLIVNTHLHPITLLPYGNSTKLHVSVFSRARISSRITFFHSRIAKVSSIVLGTSILERFVVKA